MSDRHLCKAKRTDNGEWVEGYYCKRKTGYFDNTGFHEEYKDCIITEFLSGGIAWCYIDPSTICQCPGYKGIWEHDIFQYDDDWYQIEYDEVSLVWNAVSMSGSEVVKLGEFCPEEIDVIGNIFNNPELLEGETEC